MVSVDPTVADRPEDVLGLLREQASLFARLETFADRQRVLVAEEDTRSLLAVLADRQKISAKLTQIAGTLAPVRRDWATYRGKLSEPQQAEADKLVENAARQLRGLIEGDERDARMLLVRKKMTGDAIRATHSSGHAVAAYHMRSGGSGNSRRLDEAS